MKTIYTKPLRMPDSMPTRISDVLTLTEEEGKVTKIERSKGGKIENISTGGDNSYTIKGEFTHELDSILFPEGEEQDVTSDDILGIFKATDKEYIDLQNEVINAAPSYYPMSVSCLSDGSNVPGFKKCIEDLMNAIIPASAEIKEVCDDCLSCISDKARLVGSIYVLNEIDNKFISFLEDKNFTVFPNPTALQCTLGANAVTSSMFEKYLQDKQKFGMFLEMYVAFTSMALCSISFYDTNSESYYMLVYLNSGSRKIAN